jgi:aromatic-L-amino-acid decarboxylase
MIDHLSQTRRRPVWVDAPAEARAHFCHALPTEGRPLAEALDDFDRFIKPYATGNTHPLFMGWVHGAGTPVGMVAEDTPKGP